MVLTNDIYKLWKFFAQMGQSTAIGMVENQSDVYIPKKYIKNPWPAIGRGFNGGVLMMDLKKLR